MQNNINDNIITEIVSNSQPKSINYASILTEYCVIKVCGVDNKKFLQGQISVNMENLPTLQWRLGVACNPQGRMYTSFKILNTGIHYLLLMHKSLQEDTLLTLKKYTPFFKVSLEVTNYISIGFISKSTDIIASSLNLASLPAAYQLTSQHNIFIWQALSNKNGYQCLIPRDQLPTYQKQLCENFTIDTGNTWQLNNISNVYPELCAATAYKYIPQNLNQPAIGAVSFVKGCFTGQEIITRTQNLGSVKNITYHLTVATDTNLAIGDDVFNADNKKIGSIIQLAINTENIYEILAVIKYDEQSQAAVFIDKQATVQAKVHKLPYAIDQKKELQQ